MIDQSLGLVAGLVSKRPVCGETPGRRAKYRVAQTGVPVCRPSTYYEPKFIENPIKKVVEFVRVLFENSVGELRMRVSW